MDHLKRIKLIFKYSYWDYFFDPFGGMYFFMIYKNSVACVYQPHLNKISFIGNGFWDFIPLPQRIYFKDNLQMILDIVDKKTQSLHCTIALPSLIEHDMPFIDYTLGLKKI